MRPLIRQYSIFILVLAVLATLLISSGVSVPAPGIVVISIVGSIGARVAIAILPEMRWRTWLIVGAMFLGWFLWVAVDQWAHAEPAAVVTTAAMVAAFPAFIAWFACRRHRLRTARPDANIARVFD